MPIREYECRICWRRFEERFVSALAADLAEHQGIIRCPNCGSPRVDKQVSQTARPRFKGSGFYENDYRKGAEYPTY